MLKFLRRRSRWQAAVIVLSLVACTLQAFVAQTHVHSWRLEVAAATGISTTAPAATGSLAAESGRDSPGHLGRNAPETCPLCQAVLHGGGAPPPSFALSKFPATSTSVVVALPVPFGTSVSVSYSWQGRAPPLG